MPNPILPGAPWVAPRPVKLVAARELAAGDIVYVDAARTRSVAGAREVVAVQGWGRVVESRAGIEVEGRLVVWVRLRVAGENVSWVMHPEQQMELHPACKDEST